MTDDHDLPEDMLRLHRDAVYAWGRRHNRGQPSDRQLDVDALVGDVFHTALRLWRAEPGKRPSGEKWKPWLSAITKFKILEAGRAMDDHAKVVRGVAASFATLRDYLPDPADEFADRERLAIIHKCVQALPQSDRLLISQVWSGKPLAAIAKELGLSREAAGMRVTRMRRYLKGKGGLARPSTELKALREAIERGTHD